MFGDEIKNDFGGLITKKQIDEGLCMPVLCEGCGPIHVDPEGERIDYELDVTEPVG